MHENLTIFVRKSSRNSSEIRSTHKRIFVFDAANMLSIRCVYLRECFVPRVLFVRYDCDVTHSNKLHQLESN